MVLGAQSFLNRGLGGTAVEDALPVELSRRVDAVTSSSAARGAYRVSLTEAGAQHPITRLGLSPRTTRGSAGTPCRRSQRRLRSARRSPGATVLATTSAAGASRPLIAVQRYGEGRSMVFTGEASWRWRMMLPSTDRSYETFWRQSVRWLALGATDPVAVFPAPRPAPGRASSIRTAVRDADLHADRAMRTSHVTLSGPDGRHGRGARLAWKRERQTRRCSRATFTPGAAGPYRVSVTARRGRTEIGTASSTLLVGGADLEMAQPRLNAALLERIAAQTGGHVIERRSDRPHARGPAECGAGAPSLSARRDIWHSAWSLLFIIGLLAAEWLLRRQWGLR